MRPGRGGWRGKEHPETGACIAEEEGASEGAARSSLGEEDSWGSETAPAPVPFPHRVCSGESPEKRPAPARATREHILLEAALQRDVAWVTEKACTWQGRLQGGTRLPVDSLEGTQAPG